MIAGSRPRPGFILVTLLGIALFGFLLGLILPIMAPMPNALPVHAIFALGIMPLIMGAMTWFTPVLTRTAAPESVIWAPPLLALAAGLLLLCSLQYDFMLYSIAAVPALFGIVLLSRWMQRRGKQALGNPHPGLLWYRLALAALGLGLIAILLGRILPDYWIQLRQVHLHLNTLGFIGLTALGTLRVLLPTVTHMQDDKAVLWLQGEWAWLVTGTLLIAAGAANRNLAILGAALWLPPLIKLVRHPIKTHAKALFTPHGAAPALAGAIVGMFLTLASGVAHALFQYPAVLTIQVFIWAFLFPLVTGAATHLLPLWIDPESGRARAQLQHRIGMLSGARTLLFLTAGSLTFTGVKWGWILAGLALLHFFATTARGMFFLRSR